MKNKRLWKVLVMAAAIACTMTACSFGEKESDSQIIVDTETTPTPEAEPTPSIAADVQTTRYTSANKLISIELPDATWSNKIDEEDMWSFEAPGQGKILIIHGDKEDIDSMVMPNTEDMAASLEAAADMEADKDFAVNNYTSKEKKGVNIYTYAVKYYDKEKSNGYAYTVNRIFENGEEYFSIIGSVKNKDSFTAIKDAIKTLQIGEASALSAAAPMTVTAKKNTAENVNIENTEKGSENASENTDAAEAENTAADNSSSKGGFTEEELSDTSKTRTLYRNSDGKALVIYSDAEGNWKDADGNTYSFATEEDAYDQNENSYYYHGEAADVYYMPVE